MDLSLHVAQKQILSQKMQQSAEILQMNGLELEDFVQEVAVENPVLEWEEELVYADMAKTIEWLAQPKGVMGGLFPIAKGFSGEVFEKQKEESLEESLLSQINLLPIGKKEKKALYFLVESLDEAGYLEQEVTEDIKAILGMETQEAEKMVSLLQTLEPVGVGARNLRECLLLQIKKRKPRVPLAEAIIENHLELLGKNQLHVIAKKCKVKIAEIATAKDVIQSLNPKPGSGFSCGKKEEYILPDIFVMEEAGALSVSLGKSILPRLTISSYYKDILTTEVSDAAKNYIVNKIKQAQWVMECIRKREETLHHTAEAIVAAQDTFFRTPNGDLEPLRLLDIAEVLGLHESTISRTIRGKYLQCNRGLFPLRDFFTTAVVTKNEKSVSTKTVQNRMRDLLEKEEKTAPISDQKMTDLLKAEGVQISRRTVAKYREGMGIPAQSGRKQY